MYAKEISKRKSKNKPEPTPMEKVARDIQKQLKYSWSDWF